MSTQESSIPLESPAPLSASAVAVHPFWQRLSAALESAGEWFNPLLVKEVRQALKSRQFSFTFTLVLCLGWVWSIAGITRLGPEAAYGSNGPEMFFGYYVILAFPLLLIVPYSAFRSLIAEREDNTYELVAITALRPRQIVGGKLGSAVAQMVVYLSAVAPCLAFTYLLHGIDVLSIAFIIFYTFLGSLGFSLAALLVATVAKEKHWQVLVAVAIIVALFWAFIGACGLCHDFLRSSRLPFHDPDFWIGNLALQTGFWSTFVLFYLAAAAQLTFTAENRSTPLRIAMLAQQVLFIGWIAFMMFNGREREFRGESILGASMACLLLTTLYWYFMGSIMIGEATELSPRVKRRLPQSFFGRMFLTWFNPGPGTGYMFAIGNTTAAAMMALIASWYASGLFTARVTGAPTITEVVPFAILILAYLAIYLGVVNLLLRPLRRVAQVTLATSFLINALVLLCGWGIPWVIREAMNYRNSGYIFPLHMSDPFWSCFVAIDPRNSSAFADDLLLTIVPIAVVVLLLNLVHIAREIGHVRVTPPRRVAEEDQQLAAASQPAPSQPVSPFD